MTADAVVIKARELADAELAAARRRTDRNDTGPGAPSPGSVKRTRKLEDEVVSEERDAADETVREERSARDAQLSVEREETDDDLFTERIRADDSLATRDAFLRIVSHDLRNMLSASLANVSLIERDLAREDHAQRIAKYAQNIRTSGARMNRLIGDLVDVASIEAGALAVQREKGDVTEIVAEAVGALQGAAAAREVSLTFEPGGERPSISFDPARILQVLINLISNAIKFTPAKGEVVVRADRVGEDVRFEVRDTGAGIPAGKLEAIFERYFQVANADRRGLGLGLYISKAIVQGHGGKIWAESRVGEGSTFYVTLPLEPTTDAKQAPGDAR